MQLGDRLLADMKAAMKAGDEGKLRLSVIRMVRAAIKNAEIDRRRSLADQEILEVLAREVKQRREALPDYERSGRHDLVEQLRQEIAILQDYLPAQLSAAELRALVQQSITRVGAAGPRDMGAVMKDLLPQTTGRADGKVVSAIVKEMLGG